MLCAFLSLDYFLSRQKDQISRGSNSRTTRGRERKPLGKDVPKDEPQFARLFSKASVGGQKSSADYQADSVSIT